MMIGPSGRSLHLTMRWNDNNMAEGTGFIGQLDGRHYLVSVKHNFAGRDPETGQFLGRHPIGPNNVVVRATASDGSLGWKNVSFPLVGEDGAPLWFEDPAHPEFDIAALEISLDSEARFEPYLLDEPAAELHPMLAVTDELYVVGFPRGLAYNVNMPIWSRATVASEPGAGFNGRPVFLIDVRTTKGHSGSPVIIKPRADQAIRMVDDSMYKPSPGDAWVAGVYSGRVKTRGRKLNLGVVWRLGAVIHVIRSRTVRSGDDHAHWYPLPGEFI